MRPRSKHEEDEVKGFGREEKRQSKIAHTMEGKRSLFAHLLLRGLSLGTLGTGVYEVHHWERRFFCFYIQSLSETKGAC